MYEWVKEVEGEDEMQQLLHIEENKVGTGVALGSLKVTYSPSVLS